MRPPARWTCDRKSRDPARFGDILEGMPAAQPADAVAWHHKLPMIPCELPVGGGTELTEQARAVAKAARDAAIVAGREAGKSNREIARDIGVPRRPVDRVDTGPKENTSDLAHPPILSAVAARKLDELASPPAQNWSVAGGRSRLGGSLADLALPHRIERVGDLYQTSAHGVGIVLHHEGAGQLGERRESIRCWRRPNSPRDA
jgi:hypothetical protein